jgi:putative hemolysin
MKWLARLAAPAVVLLSASTDLIVRLFRSHPADDQAVTQEEIEAMLVQGAATGVLEPQEHKIVERVFRLADQRMTSHMTPRTDIVWLDADASPERIRIVIATESHSHFPVCEGSLDKLLGVVHVKDLVKNGLITGAIELRPLVRPPLFVPESSPALSVLELFREQGVHIAFVLDEYGALEGLVTLGDIMEGIVGQIARTGEETEPHAIRRDEHSWLLDGMLAVDELRQIMDTDELPKQQEAAYQTVGGLVMAMLGRIPSAGDAFTWRHYRFEVMDMDRQRVDKVLLTIEPEQPLEAAL